MKRFLILMLFLLAPAVLRAQKFKEWFRQKKTQQQYLTEQIVQLKIYLELVEKGYQTARNGLSLIGSIKNGEFRLHRNEFDSLSIVKSRIITMGRLQQVADMQDIVHEICETLPKDLHNCHGLDGAQKERIQRGITNLYADGQSLIGALLPLIRDKNYAMTDAERIERIEGLFQQFEANYSFARSFKMQIALFCQQVSTDKEELENRKILHDLND